MSTANQVFAAMECTMAVVTFILFFAALAKKHKKISHRAFLILTMTCGIMLVIDGVYRVLGGDGSGAEVQKILWVPKYAIEFFIFAMFHEYILRYIESRETDLHWKIPMWFSIIPYPIGVASVIAFSMSMKSGLFYRFDEAGVVCTEYFWLSKLGYFVLLGIDVLTVLVNRKRIGIKNTVVLMFCGAFPIFMLRYEIEYALPLIEMSIPLLLIYIFIDLNLEQEMTLLEMERDVALMRSELNENKTKLMLSQISPHFLYNTISSVMLLCREDPIGAEEALSDFSEYLRGNLDSLLDRSEVPFTKELEHLKTYMRIEKRRFFDKLNVGYDINFTDFSLPSLCIQPLAENAVKHGVGMKKGGGTVRITSEKVGDRAIIKVMDNGVGFDVKAAEKAEFQRGGAVTHVGISSVRSRLQIISGADLDIKSFIGEGTVITVRVPLHEKKTGDR